MHRELLVRWWKYGQHFLKENVWFPVNEYYSVWLLRPFLLPCTMCTRKNYCTRKYHSYREFTNWLLYYINGEMPADSTACRGRGGILISELAIVTLYATAMQIPFKITLLWLIQQWSSIVLKIKAKKRVTTSATSCFFFFSIFPFTLPCCMYNVTNRKLTIGKVGTETCGTQRVPFRLLRFTNGPFFLLENWFRYRSRFRKLFKFWWIFL